jgi:hypothetical protein
MKIRIDNIGAQPPTYLGKPPEDVDNRLVIVKFFPNEKYGRLQEYIDDGCVMEITSEKICVAFTRTVLKAKRII